MTINLLIITNLLTYCFSLKIFFSLFNKNYTFPFRHADIYSFVLNLITFSIFSYIYFPKYFFIFFLINLNLFYIFFNLINMIVTSPRTKIIIDLKSKKNTEININHYLKKYNCNIIVNNRIKRLKTSRQIIEKNNYFY